MKTSAPLSRSQYGIYAECVGHEGEAYYNLPYLYTLDGGLDAERLCRAVVSAVAAHPTLLTRIVLADDGEPLQVVDTDAEPPLEVMVEHIADIEAVKPSLIEPFELVGGRLCRYRVLRDGSHLYLFCDLHHIIADGTTLAVMLHDIEAAYRGEPLAAEALTMAQVADDEHARRQTPAFDEARQWYAHEFDCGDIDTPLMPDRREGASREASQVRVLGVDMTRVDEFCRAGGVYKSGLFTAAFALLLAKFNNEQASVFTTVYNGRTDKRFAHSAGMTVKTLPVYSKFEATTTVLDYLHALQEQMSGCRHHDVYAYSDLHHDLDVHATTSMVWHGTLFADRQFAGLPMSTHRLGNSTIGVPFYLKVFLLDGRCHAKAEYDAGQYSDALVAQILESYEATVSQMLTATVLADIDIATDAQRALLDGFNDTDVAYDDTQTIVSLFRRQAAATPGAPAVVSDGHTYTYGEVDDLSDRIAAHIAGLGLGREDVVSVLIERNRWMAIASLGVLKAGCAYQPLDPTYPRERLNFMMHDAGSRLLIADANLRDIVDEYDGPVLLTADAASLPAATTQPDGPRPGDLMIMLYTSGSTGVPKGCQLVHSNLVAFCHWYHRYYSLDAGCRVAAYASYGFDANMMDLYPALTCGACVHIIPEDMRLDLIALGDYFERNGITHAFMTTQVGCQFATTIDGLTTLRYLSTGGEKMPPLTPPQSYKLVNGYGPTEVTIFTTTHAVQPGEHDIPIGRPLDNMRLYVVDPAGRRLPVGAAGELWAAGPQVSRGYLNRPDKQAEVYIANPFTGEQKYARVYRTGDIVRYLPNGEIQFVGRRDGQVKIRGFRIELKEVEAVIREFPGITDVTVQAFDEDGGGKYVAAYVVSPEAVDVDALNAFITERKPPYMVPAVTMQIDAIPLNQNQKVNRRALPMPEKRAAAPVAESNVPLNVLETALHGMVAAIVGSGDFGVTTPLGQAGLTSITAIKLAVQVNKRYGVALDTKSLVKSGSVQSIENAILEHLLAAHDGTAPGATGATAQPAQALTEAPLTYAQTGVYFECLKNPTSTIYNIPYLLTWPGGVTAEALADAVRTVVNAHPVLGAHFETRGADIALTTADARPATVTIEQMTDDELNDYKHAFVRPFNLQRPPLYRFEVVTTPSGVHLLMDVHHLLFDGGSADLLICQIIDSLEGRPVEHETYDYLQFAAHQQETEQGEAMTQAREFFARQLASCEGASEIPADYSSADTGFIGEAVSALDHEASAAFCREQGVTPAQLFYAAAAYVASRFTGSRDVYLCTVSSGRSDLRIADTVGMFVNTVPLAISIGDTTVAEYLRAASASFDDTLRHENYPMARIAADFAFKPAIAYAYQVGVLNKYCVNGHDVAQELLELNVPKFKINIKIETRGVVVQYDDAAYSPATAQSIADGIAAVAAQMIAKPGERVRTLSIIGELQAALLDGLRSVAEAQPTFALFHDCLAHYATTNPDHEALVACDATLTYAALDRATDRVARALQARGVQPRDRVALLLPRTSRLIIAQFGVMKAGAAYIPCDPEYPADRIRLILDDSQARYIVTTADRLNTVDASKAIDVEQLLAGDDYTKPATTGLTPDDLAYIIYTSGSTGRPKGVMLRHEGICNYLTPHPANVLAHAVATEAERVLGVTTISFDAALQDIGHALYNGKTLVLATEEQANNPIALSRLITDERVDMVSGTPSRWLTWLTSDDFVRAIAHISIARAGGEKFSDQLLGQLRSATSARIINCYGPTETTVACNNKDLTHAERVTVGRPQLGVTEWVVDADGNELPAGVVGELLIGGRGVGRGYNNLDEMTRERFVTYRGLRAYRSGDYAKWTLDGDIVILGRTDNQIKLRGLRIELGEIENVMLAVDGVEKVVILIRHIGGKEHLCAYYTATRTIAPEDLKAEIAKSLTQYMVPTAYLQLPAMPLTPNGKTDVKALPEPVLAAAAAYVEPATDAERTFCAIFADILQMERVGATDNFFDLGGTSLVVTRVIIEADKAGLHVAYGDVFAHPTPRQLAHLVTGEAADDSVDEAANYDYTAIDSVLRRGTLDAFRHGERQPLGRVLVTGATGFLGIHILHELIAGEATDIYCLVRGTNADEAESRLRTLLFYYFDDAYASLFGTRLRIVLGDVTSPIDPAVEVDTLFNCAAVVKHFAEGTEIEDVNIGGAERCVDYCLQHGARLVHVSTASTRGLWAGEPHDDVFTEQRLYMGQFLGNKYIYSKYMAERLILEAVATRGLSAKIMRVGNLAARSTDGEFQANFQTNSFMGRIKVYNMLGCCPYAMRNKRVEFSPINEVSCAIVLLAGSPRECCVFHPYNNHTQFLGDVLESLSTVGEGIRFVEQEDFDRAMEQAKSDPAKSRAMASLLAYQDMAHGQRTTDVARDNDYTTQVLYRLGHVWSPTSRDYVERMLTAISGLGFFD